MSFDGNEPNPLSCTKSFPELAAGIDANHLLLKALISEIVPNLEHYPPDSFLTSQLGHAIEPGTVQNRTLGALI
jgi:hypothetical protein